MKNNKFIQHLHRQILIVICFIILAFSVQAQVVVIDPGHGYDSNGVNRDGRTTTEIETALSAGLKLRNLINNNNCGWTVRMTRATNGPGGWTSVTQRATMANNWNATRFISIHCNGGGGTGTETFYCNQSASNTATDFAFARKVQDDMVQYGAWRDRRCVEDRSHLPYHLGVLRINNAPACLSEIGFVDSGDKTKLLSDSWRNKFAKAYYESLQDELGNCSGGGGGGGGGGGTNGSCPATRSVTGSISSATYQASGSITSTGTVSSGTVTLKSPVINLNNDFTVSGGTFTAQNTGCSGNKEEQQAFYDFSIQPNPFGNTTQIKFTLSEELPVTIWISDMMGRHISTLTNDEMTSTGEHQVTFEAGDYTAGMYFATIQAGEYFGTQKMILTK